MKNITKEVAKIVANKMCEGIDNKTKELSNELNEFCIKLYVDKIPKHIQEKLLGIPVDYLETVSYSYFRYESLTTYHSFHKSVIGCLKDVSVDKDSYELIKQFQDRLSKLRDEYSKYYNQIIETLLKLRTLNKIQKDFPEAYELIPEECKKQDNPLSLPIKNIVEELNKFK